MKRFLSPTTPIPGGLVVVVLLSLTLIVCNGDPTSPSNPVNTGATSIEEVEPQSSPDEAAEPAPSTGDETAPEPQPAPDTRADNALSTDEETEPPATTGLVTGQVTLWSASGELQPLAEADLEMISDEGDDHRRTIADQAGHYTFDHILPDVEYLINAYSSFGYSNPIAITVSAGESKTVDIQTISASPFVHAARAGGYVLVDGQPVAGATVWQFTSLNRIVTDEAGYFGFYYTSDAPIVAVFEDWWTVTSLLANQIIDIELNRQGMAPTPPDGPLVEAIPIDELTDSRPAADILIQVLPELVTPVPLRTLPGEIRIQPQPQAGQTSQPLSELKVIPMDTIRVLADDSVLATCNQTAASADYGPIKVGSIVVLGRPKQITDQSEWPEKRQSYLNMSASVTKLAGVDQAGCPGVMVDIDNETWFWPIRDLTVVQP